MVDAPPGLTESELLTAIAPATVSPRQLLRLRAEGCLPKRRAVRGGGRGKPPTWVFPAGTDRQLRAIVELRRRGVRSFPELRTALWLAGYAVRMRARDLLQALPQPQVFSDAEIQEAAEAIVQNPRLLGPAAQLIDSRADTDWMALVQEVGEFAAGGGLDIRPESELGRWMGEGAQIAGLDEVRDALSTATAAELAWARRDLARMTDMARASEATRRISGLGRKSDRAVRYEFGRGVELALGLTPTLVRLATRERGFLALVVGALIASGRRGLPHLDEPLDVDALERTTDALAAYRTETPGLGDLLSASRMHKFALDSIDAEHGDKDAAARVEEHLARLREAAAGHRAEIEKFLARHPEARVDPEEDDRKT